MPTPTDPAGKQDLSALLDDVIPPGSTEPMGAYLFSSADPAAELGRRLERTVFLEAFGNTPDLLEAEYDPYEPASIFFVVVDHRRRRPAGTMRIIVPSFGGPPFKTLADIPGIWEDSAEALYGRRGYTLPPAATWDIATLAVDAGYRGNAAVGLVSMGLYQSVIRTALACRVDYLIAILDDPVYRMAKWKFHHPFVSVAEERPYLGSDASHPVAMDIATWADRLVTTDPVLRDLLCEGRGLEPALRPLDVEAATSLALAAAI
jgi:hypothetical protein